MHPAFSVIFFTVTSGAGFGFLALIGLGVPLPESGAGAFIASLIAGGLAVAGLISSTFHLGHPERAWRAFTQWRSSWLSREGVCAVITLCLFGFYAMNWVFFETRITWLGLLISAGACMTVFTTAMIYAQLRTVPHWNTLLTPICYGLFALASGVLLAASFGHWQASGGLQVALIGMLAVAVAWGAKFLWWQTAFANSLRARGSTPESATGLGAIGKVRLLEKPHSGENYLTKEMVHQVGRKHATKLRMIAIWSGCGHSADGLPRGAGTTNHGLWAGPGVCVSSCRPVCRTLAFFRGSTARRFALLLGRLYQRRLAPQHSKYEPVALYEVMKECGTNMHQDKKCHHEAQIMVNFEQEVTKRPVFFNNPWKGHPKEERDFCNSPGIGCIPTQERLDDQQDVDEAMYNPCSPLLRPWNADMKRNWWFGGEFQAKSQDDQQH